MSARTCAHCGIALPSLSPPSWKYCSRCYCFQARAAAAVEAARVERERRGAATSTQRCTACKSPIYSTGEQPFCNACLRDGRSAEYLQRVRSLFGAKR